LRRGPTPAACAVAALPLGFGRIINRWRNFQNQTVFNGV
jgi:hypothetical protein